MTENEAREKRDSLLTATDWVDLPRCPLLRDHVLLYQLYRQRLRDVPQQSGFPDVVSWPIEPIEYNPPKDDSFPLE
jgi:hypothetical protein